LVVVEQSRGSKQQSSSYNCYFCCSTNPRGRREQDLHVPGCGGAESW
jgi:hypothetical protein